MRRCDACGNTQFGIILDNLSHEYTDESGKMIAWSYQLLECTQCGLGFIDPKPNWELLQTFYGPKYGCYDHSKIIPIYEAKSLKYRIARLRFTSIGGKGLQARIFTGIGILMEWLSGKTVSYSLGVPLTLSHDAFIFELGYGAGNWLLSMVELGYHNLYGYDIEANPENKIRLSLKGIHVSSGMFLENEYPADFFDCIRLEHVFEHLLEPIQVLKKCHSMLKPGGYLVLNFPCKTALSFEMSPKHYAHLEVPRHLYHHTKLSALKMLQNAGFRIKSLKTYPVALVFGASINNMLKAKHLHIPRKIFSLCAPFYALTSSITGRGENITILAIR